MNIIKEEEEREDEEYGEINIDEKIEGHREMTRCHGA